MKFINMPQIWEVLHLFSPGENDADLISNSALINLNVLNAINSKYKNMLMILSFFIQVLHACIQTIYKLKQIIQDSKESFSCKS